MFEDGSQRAGNDGVGIREEICDEMGGSTVRAAATLLQAKISKKFQLFLSAIFFAFLEVVDRMLDFFGDDILAMATATYWLSCNAAVAISGTPFRRWLGCHWATAGMGSCDHWNGILRFCHPFSDSLIPSFYFSSISIIINRKSLSAIYSLYFHIIFFF